MDWATKSDQDAVSSHRRIATPEAPDPGNRESLDTRPQLGPGTMTSSKAIAVRGGICAFVKVVWNIANRTCSCWHASGGPRGRTRTQSRRLRARQRTPAPAPGADPQRALARSE